jgi:hypothetical protein
MAVGVLRVEIGERALDGERRPHGALGIVLLRPRKTEERHPSVAQLLQHMAAELVHSRRRLVEIQISPVLGIKLRWGRTRAVQNRTLSVNRSGTLRCPSNRCWKSQRPEAFRHLVLRIPGIDAGQVDMLPAERGDMFEQVVRQGSPRLS